MERIATYLMILAALIACSSDDNGNTAAANQITDARDGQTYKIVTLGTQTWMAENLNFNTNDQNSACYDQNDSNCFIYGRLYHGSIAKDACPDGWHLPTVDEWNTLFTYLGGANVAHNLVAPNATIQGNLVNFNLLPAGHKLIDYKDLGTKGHYWTSTDGGLPNSMRNVTYIPTVSIKTSGTSSLGIMKSCRCVKD